MPDWLTWLIGGGGLVGLAFVLWSLWHVPFEIEHLGSYRRRERVSRSISVANVSRMRLTAHGPPTIVVIAESGRRPLATDERPHPMVAGNVVKVTFMTGVDGPYDVEVRVHYRTWLHRWVRRRNHPPWTGTLVLPAPEDV